MRRAAVGASGPGRFLAKISAGVALAVALIAVPLVSASQAGAELVRLDTFAPGSAPAGAAALGSVPATENLSISVVIPPQNQRVLNTLLHEQSDPSSPEFHHWLSSSQYQSEFGPSPSDAAAVTSWLRSNGFAPTTSGYTVRFDATEAAVSSALGTSFERYRLADGHSGYVASSTPEVPADLSTGQITSILGLNTAYEFSSSYEPVPPGTSTGAPTGGAFRSHADGLSPCAGAANAAAPGYYTFDEEGADYGVGSLLSAGENGAGETVGLFELGQSSSSDLATYKSCFGLSNAFSTVPVDGGAAVDANATGEADLDAEEAMTQAPGANVVSYEGPNTVSGVYDTWNQIVSADTVQVISSSWGLCETDAESDGTQGAYTALFEQASAQGQSVFVASGDSGSEGCFADDGTTFEQTTYPASDPWVTAVGGTSMFEGGATDQTAWNSCGPDESTACANLFGGLAAGGGGMSRYETRPSYQPNILEWGVSESCGTECREVPDISANAGVGMVLYANGAWGVGAGTSFAAPFMSGLVADADSGCGRIGVMTPLLYGLYSYGSYGSGSAFADVASGNTDMTGSNSGAFPATANYDAATGIGSPYAAGLTCASVSSVSAGYSGSTVTVSGLGLEHAAIDFGPTPATVQSATATSAVVTVPAGSGTVTVSASSIAGGGGHGAQFTYGTAPPPPPPFPPPAAHGYWLVGSDGGIFTFGSSQFYGSTGSLHLQRPVVGIVPTIDRSGYWLDASDGGIFAFGDSGFYGSIPGLGLHPAGSGQPNSLDAPIVGMVPSTDGGGYFMVASDGGVFAFGDARFAGSCPGIGGCSGAAVAVMPDASGNGYWLVTQSGHIYTFGDAPYFGAPGPQSVPVTSAVRTPDGRGYWILFANGAISNFGDAGSYGSPAGQMGGLNPATAIFTTSDGGGYWVAAANGAVASYGDAPNDGSMLGSHLNGNVIAATGF